METRNVFLYWVGKEYKLISILRNLIYLHSTNGKGYKVNLITDKNIGEYIKTFPDCFSKLCPAHQADFVRVNVIYEYGGIWLDSDTVVIDKLDSLFDLIENKNGFFINHVENDLCNTIFGSRKHTLLMKEWKNKINETLDVKKENIQWCDIGSLLLNNMFNSNKDLYDNYIIFNGLDNLIPVRWDFATNEYLDQPYDNYKNIVKDYQPLVCLFNSVYKKIEEKTESEILNGNMPLNYFINKSFQNMKLIDYDLLK
jgi:mannosyltransferase OCH1-like enzyme